MYPSVKEKIPEFISEYLVFSDCFTDLNKQKTCLVLTKNLKLFEFYQKQLMASIDLNKTCLRKHKEDLNNYEGFKGKWCDSSSVDGVENSIPVKAEECDTKPISFGKYVFHALNIFKIYILIKCWDKCVVVKRLSEFRGFEIKAEYEHVLSYVITHGSLKFCPIVEFQFQSSILRTDFEDKSELKVHHDLDNSTSELKQLLEHIRSAKTELQLHKSITAKSFHTLQNNLTMGLPFLRDLKLEEKQMLNRCGDIWKRLTHHGDLIIGIPLVNQCSSPNLSIIRNISPVLQPNALPHNAVYINYRLFQLKLKFDKLDELETYLETEDEHLQGSIWHSNGDLQILPESFAVLLVKLKISEIIFIKESPLILNYEVIKHIHGTPDVISRHSTMPLQLFLHNLNFHKILFEDRFKYEITFAPETLHQDFLAISMTSEETILNIVFGTIQDLKIMEKYIQEKLEFTKHYGRSENLPFLFYNTKNSSLWFGSLILRMKEIISEEDELCATTWKIYCCNFNKTLLLVKAILNDLLTINCNILSITSNKNPNNIECIKNFNNFLREELLQIQKILNAAKDTKSSEKLVPLLENLCYIQLNTDFFGSNLLKNK